MLECYASAKVTVMLVSERWQYHIPDISCQPEVRENKPHLVQVLGHCLQPLRRTKVPSPAWRP